MDEQQQTPEPAVPETPTPRPRRRWRLVLLRLLAVVVAVVAGLLVTFFTYDLGPELREQAERGASAYLARPMHIGRLSARIVPGVFVLEDVVIEGLEPGHRPHLTAKTITVEFPWWSVFRRTIEGKRDLAIRSIEMTDWHMVIETWPATPEHPRGHHNLPRYRPEPRPRQEPGRFREWFGEITTTLRSVVASRGHLVYVDHGTPWSIIAPDLRVTLGKAFDDYRGTASFAGATIQIQEYQPFGAEMQARWTLDGTDIHFDRIDLRSDGARSVIDGDLDLARWPEQIYRIRSTIDIPTQKDIFFHRDDFRATGEAAFVGTFHLFEGGRELKGTFRSPLVGVNDWRFPDLEGEVFWDPAKMHVTNARSGLYGGTARFDYLLAPLNRPGVRTHAAWDVEYEEVDLARLTDFLETEGIRLAGRISGRNRLEWPLGGWADRRGGGVVTARMPPGHTPMTRGLDPDDVALRAALPPELGPFNPRQPLGYVPVAGRVEYQLDPAWITLAPGWAATGKTHVAFEGRTAYGQRSTIPFHVTSLDWQESDRVLAGIMTAFGAPTGAVPIGGFGEFDGVMLGAFADPRIEGRFSGDRMRAWNVVWGRGTADIVVEDGYVHVKESAIVEGDSEITATGRFSLGYPRRDGGEEIDASVVLRRRPLVDLRRAFELEDYPIEGFVSGEYRLQGFYETPTGVGRLVIEDGVAYGETFERMEAPLRFEGNGVRLESFDIRKSTGSMTGAAWVSWDGSYSFNADGRRIPVESLETVAFPTAPFSGLLQFNASGAGTFEVPRYDVKARVDDLFAGDEGIGQVTGRLGLRGELLTAEFDAISPRLQVSGSGRIALTPEMDAEMTFRFTETSLDPYVRFFEPRLSPFTTAVASGGVRLVGELTDLAHLMVDARVDQLDMKLFDYPLSNRDPAAGAYRPLEIAMQHHGVEIRQFRLFGEGTRLDLTGAANLFDSTLAVRAEGDANLGILQGFFRDIRSSGSARLEADVEGTLEAPVFEGSAAIVNGRIRHFALPHSLEAINGTARFDATGLRIDGITAKLAEGDIVFGGRIGLAGFYPGAVDVSAAAKGIRLRYPEGFRSHVDADLQLTGDLSALSLTGDVTVLDARYTRRFDLNPDLFGRGTAGVTGVPGSAAAAGQAPPVRYDVRIVAPQGALRVENNVARLVSSAELQLQGTYDRPVIFGQADIERGDLLFEGNRYVVNHGTISFSNPQRIEPYFDFEAETRVRFPGQTYVVTIGVNGVVGGPTPPVVTFSSDPPLSTVDIFSLLLGETEAFATGEAELRSLSAAGAARSEEELLKAAGARLLGGALSAPVGRVVEQTLGLDTVQITPIFGGGESDPLSPSARLIIGKRLSNRAYVTFARALGNVVRDQSIVLEYDQSDRLGWVLTQTGDHTFAVDFRVRRSF
jgi:translocation and assembly module TamB